MALRSSRVPAPGCPISPFEGPHAIDDPFPFRECVASSGLLSRWSVLSFTMVVEASLPRTLFANPCRDVHDFPQSPVSELARSFPLLMFKLSPFKNEFRGLGFRDEEREGCVLGRGDGSRVMKGDSAGEAFWWKSLENSSKPVSRRLLRGLSEAVLPEEEPVREWVAEPGVAPFITFLYSRQRGGSA